MSGVNEKREWFRQLPVVKMRSTVERKEGIGKESGKSYLIRSQLGYLVRIDEDGEEIKTPIKVQLNRDQEPYPVGYAVVSGACIGVESKYGKPMFNPYQFGVVPLPRSVSVALGLVDGEASDVVKLADAPVKKSVFG